MEGDLHRMVAPMELFLCVLVDSLGSLHASMHLGRWLLAESMCVDESATAALLPWPVDEDGDSLRAFDWKAPDAFV